MGENQWRVRPRFNTNNVVLLDEMNTKVHGITWCTLYTFQNDTIGCFEEVGDVNRLHPLETIVEETTHHKFKDNTNIESLFYYITNKSDILIASDGSKQQQRVVEDEISQQNKVPTSSENVIQTLYKYN